MAFAIKGQTKAAEAFKGNFGVYGAFVWPLIAMAMQQVVPGEQ